MTPFVHKCTRCGYTFVFPDNCLVFECPACSVPVARPQATGNALTTLQRANELRLDRAFDRAEEHYMQVLQESPNEHEALWGRLLSHYGVEYVEEEATGRRHPVVHIIRTSLMQEEPDFQRACRYAPEEVAAQYRRDAAYIDETQLAINKLTATVKPYDVFLCHKTTKPGSSEYTKDFIEATNLYHFLKENGIRTFFAPESLQSVAGANYEAGICHALRTARTMLVICSDTSFLNSTWVRSEWSRFLALADADRSKRLIPLLYNHFPAEKLPAPFLMRHLQGLDMTRLNAAQALLEVLGVQKEEKPVAKSTGKPGKEQDRQQAKPPVETPPISTEYHIDLTFPQPHSSWKTIPSNWKVYDSDKKTILASVVWGKTVRVPLPAEYDVLWIGPDDMPHLQAKQKKKRILWGIITLICLAAGIVLCVITPVGDEMFSMMLWAITSFFATAMFSISFSSSLFNFSFQVAANKRYRLKWRLSSINLKCITE